MIRRCPVCTTPREEDGPFDCCTEVILMEQVKKLKSKIRELNRRCQKAEGCSTHRMEQNQMLSAELERVNKVCEDLALQKAFAESHAKGVDLKMAQLTGKTKSKWSMKLVPVSGPVHGIFPEMEMAERPPSALETENSTLREIVKRLQKTRDKVTLCEICGKELSPGRCRTCDNDE